jgi:hypothetical protein
MGRAGRGPSRGLRCIIDAFGALDAAVSNAGGTAAAPAPTPGHPRMCGQTGGGGTESASNGI